MISDMVLVALIAGLPPTLAAIGALVVVLRNGKKADVTNARVEEISAVAVRSREEINLMKTGAFRLGVLEGERRGSKSDLGTLD